jgi:hypothetical protein
VKRTIPAALVLIGAAMPGWAQIPSPADLTNRFIQSRAVEAMIWGMPAVNFDLMFQAMLKVGGRENQIVYWSNLVDWKNQTLTPNPITIYLAPFINMKDVGPMVVEVPPAVGGSVTGTITDAWQVPLEDVGPAGADRGKGGKYLILPPGYSKSIPKGYIVLRSATNMATALLRANVSSGSTADIAKAVAYGKRIKLYPLSGAAGPPPTTFVDAFGMEYDGTIPYDIRFFQSLDRFVQREPWLERDKAVIDQLRAIGIEQGRPFKPTGEAQKLLEQAAVEARGLLDLQYEALFKPYYRGGQWALPVAPAVVEGLADAFAKPGVYPLDDRGALFSFAFSSVKKLGSGQFYLVAIRDKAGNPFVGGSTYRLTVPANAPVQLYWSATAYDRVTHALIRDQKWPSRASTTPGLQANADGSVDLFFGPMPPAGKESNWVPTPVGREWEVMVRFYGPQKPLFDKTWVLPDVEKLAAQ